MEWLTSIPLVRRGRAAYVAFKGSSQLNDSQQSGSDADLEASIINLNKALDLLLPDSDDTSIRILTHCRLGDAFLLRLFRHGDLADVDASVSNFQVAVDLNAEDERPGQRVRFLDSLGQAQFIRFKCRSDDVSDLEASIRNLQSATALADDDHPQKLSYLAKLGEAQFLMYQRQSDVSDLESSIANLERVIQLLIDNDDSDVDEVQLLFVLGGAQLNHFQHTRHSHDIDSSIINCQRALLLMEHDDSRYAVCRANIAAAQQYLWDIDGDLAYLDASIASRAEASELFIDSVQGKAEQLSTLGMAKLTRFQYLHEIPDLEASISNLQAAIELTPHAHWISSLGVVHTLRFQHLGEVADLDISISNLRRAVQLTEKDVTKAIYLNNLAEAHIHRFIKLKDVDDVDSAIDKLQSAVHLSANDPRERALYIAKLGVSQLRRYDHKGESSDLEACISNLQEAIGFATDHTVDRETWAAFRNGFGFALLRRFQKLGGLSDLETSISNLTESMELSDDDNPNFADRVSDLAEAHQARYQQNQKLDDLDIAIRHYTKAADIPCEDNMAKAARFSALGFAQSLRYSHLVELNDLDDSISNHLRALECSDEASCFYNLGASQGNRYRHRGDVIDLKSSISNLGRAVELTSNDDPHKASRLLTLGAAHIHHFLLFEQTPDIKASLSVLQSAIDCCGGDVSLKSIVHYSLGVAQLCYFRHMGSQSDVDTSIANLNIAAGTSQNAMYLCHLSNAYRLRYILTQDLHDIESAIENAQRAVKLTDKSPGTHGWAYFILGASLSKMPGTRSDSSLLSESLSAFRTATESPSAIPRIRFIAAREWARLAHDKKDFSLALVGYRTALEILPNVAWLGLNVSSQLLSLHLEGSESLACDTAACAIELGRLEDAIELLDSGRSFLWQQVSALRSDLKLLRDKDAQLAGELEDVNRLLDEGRFFDLPSSSEDRQGMEGSARLIDPEERTKQRHHLTIRREELLSRVRSQAEFKDFQKSVPFSRLREAITTGHVVILNVSHYRVDALILESTGDIHHVDLSHLDVDEIVVLCKKFSEGNLPSAPTNRFLRPMLRDLWNQIVKPVFENIGISLEPSGASPQHRIWWYPTGALTFVPIHAAGLFKGENTVDVSQLVISSYTVTLASLLRARRKASLSCEKPKRLAVSQPNTPDEMELPNTPIEVQKLTDVMRKAGCSDDMILHLQGADATVERVWNELEESSWIHFACHAIQDPVLGMESAFILEDGALQLADIAAGPLTNGRFAFLSACHAAAGSELAPGEALHLSAALQVAGFPSVIATMWTIRDIDGPKVAEETYQYLFRNGSELDPSEAATALSQAILSLRRDKKVSLNRWIPFVHIGI